ncbi:MAG: cupin domain-containing protein [Acidimicrobiales bacterium]
MTDEDGYQFTDTSTGSWRPSSQGEGIEVMDLGISDIGQQMQLVRMQPDTPYPNHRHVDPEFVYMLEGSGRQAGVWMHAGWASVANTGSLDLGFVSGSDGCTLLSVYGRAESIS